jgi:catalase-peroxidase
LQIGDEVPPPQEFQRTLPTAPEGYAPDYVGMRKMIEGLLEDDEENYGAFVDLAYRCAFTFHSTDYRGGCNGARIRFEPESEFAGNEGAAATLAILKPVSDAYPTASDADLIVLAGHTALQQAGTTTLTFCGGRVDAQDGSGSEGLAPRTYEPAVVSIRDDMEVKGLTARQGVALAARPTGSNISNQFFIKLLAGDGTFTEEELALLQGEFEAIVQEFAANEEAFMEVFASAWTYLMTADRYGDFNKNSCADVDECTMEECQATPDGAGILAGVSFASCFLVAVIAAHLL